MVFKKKYNEKLEYEFMPDLISVIDRPTSPLGSFVVWLIFIILVITMIWSVVCRVDTVSVTQGKIIPKGKLNIVNTAESGVIKKIHVKEGEKIRKGDLLFEFNTTINKKELDTIQKRVEQDTLKNIILTSEFKGFREGKIFNIDISNFNYLSDLEVQKYIDLKRERELEYLNELKKEEIEASQISDEIKIARIELKNMKGKEKILNLETQNMNESYKAGLVSEIKYLKKNNELESLVETIKSKEYRIILLKKKMETSKRNLELIRRKRKKWLLTVIMENGRDLDTSKMELAKIKQKYNFQKQYSTVNGKINKVNINNSGGFISSGTEIMTIVPETTELEAEVSVLNKDIGFVKVGQEVEVKLDTFPFQDYGKLKGKVRMISPDAIMENGKPNYVYKAYITLVTDSLLVKGKKEEVKSGMTLKGEIKTGKRRVIDFFLSPIKKSLNESINLR